MSVRQPIVQLKNISKAFDDLLALDGVTLSLFPGEILGLIGPNGSGKTTLMNILCGYMMPDSGEIWVRDRRVTFRSPNDSISRGIRMLPQSLEIYPSLSVLENIFIGQELTRKLRVPRLMAWARMEETAKTLLKRVEANTIDPHHNAGELSGGQKKAIVLARLLATEAEVLVFDEPMASLGVKQKNRLLEIFRSESSKGRSIVFITHDIDNVLSICDRVALLSKGQVAREVNRDEINQQELSLQLTTA
jgi:ABC-type sugar transport system ATPase subunit